jgi:hypothetical protein
MQSTKSCANFSALSVENILIWILNCLEVINMHVSKYCRKDTKYHKISYEMLSLFILQNDPQLQQIRGEIQLLIHRYLRSKYQCSDKANLFTSRLIR